MTRRIFSLLITAVFALVVPGVASAQTTSVVPQEATPVAATQPIDAQFNGPKLENQLSATGYHLAEQGEVWSSDSNRTLHWQVWEHGAQPAVATADTFPGGPGVRVIDTVSFDKTGKFADFWCAPDNANAFNLNKVTAAATALRQAVLNNTATPVESYVAGTYKVKNTTPTIGIVCYMK